MSGAGIYLHNTRDVTVTQNLIYNTGEVGLLMTDEDLGTYGLERSLVRQNQFVLRDVPMLSVQSSITANLFSTLGVIDSNAFCDPFGEPTFRVDLPGVGERIKTLAQWRADHGRDLASTRCADRYPSRTVTGTPGPNRVSNGNFDSDLTGWFGWPDDTLDARWETGRLDGGSVRIGYKGPSTTLHYDTSIGAVQAKQTYRLRVDAKSITGTPAFSAYLRQSGAPYAKVSQTVPLFVDGNRRTFELFFDTTASEADTLLIFEMASLGSGVGLDNVQLQTVIAPLQVLSNVVRFEANPTTQSQVITLDNYTYRGGDGTAYPARSTLTLTPFGAIVLLRGEISNATPTPPTKPTVYLSTVMK